MRVERRGDVFVTTPYRSLSLLTSEASRTPGAYAHAKTMGTNQTFCGLSTWSWSKFWNVPFIAISDARCPACWDALQARNQKPHNLGSI